MRFAAHDPLDGAGSVVACCDSAAERLDGRDGGTGGARCDDVDGGFEGGGAAGEQFNAVGADAVDGAGFGEFAKGYGLGGVEAGLVDPGLDGVEVYGGEFGGEAGV
jgi:hypothetical protein